MIEETLVVRNRIHEASEFIRASVPIKPKLALILGSGLGTFVSRVTPLFTLNARDIPHYPESSVPGHSGKLIFGSISAGSNSVGPILVFQGRVHYYESAVIERVVFPVYLAQDLGVKHLVITNAAGGINSRFQAGDLMLIDDVISLSGLPLHPGQIHSIPDFRNDGVLDAIFKQKVLECAAKAFLPIQAGTYCWLKGPSYETPAEIEMLKRIGADAVGMSTVPELIAAHRLRLRAVGVSLISNLAAGISPARLSHAEVTETAARAENRFSRLMETIIHSLAPSS